MSIVYSLVSDCVEEDDDVVPEGEGEDRNDPERRPCRGTVTLQHPDRETHGLGTAHEAVHEGPTHGAVPVPSGPEPHEDEHGMATGVHPLDEGVLQELVHVAVPLDVGDAVPHHAQAEGQEDDGTQDSRWLVPEISRTIQTQSDRHTQHPREHGVVHVPPAHEEVADHSHPDVGEHPGHDREQHEPHGAHDDHLLDEGETVLRRRPDLETDEGGEGHHGQNGQQQQHN